MWIPCSLDCLTLAALPQSRQAANAHAVLAETVHGQCATPVVVCYLSSDAMSGRLRYLILIAQLL